MTVQHKDFLLVKVKPGWTDFKIEYGNQLRYLIHGRAEAGAHCYTKTIVPGSWQIIGKADKLTEQDWEGIVERKAHHMAWDDKITTAFINYQKTGMHDMYFHDPTASGLSLLASHDLKGEETLVLKLIK